MKISKLFTGLVVCGALIFPGALSSSAQEINSSEALDLEINPSDSSDLSDYSFEGMISLSAFSAIPNSIYASQTISFYAGKKYFYSTTGIGAASATLYSGYLDYQESNVFGHVYSGTLYKK